MRCTILRSAYRGGHHFEWYKDKLSEEGIEIQESIDTRLPNGISKEAIEIQENINTTFPNRFSLDTFYPERKSTQNFYSSLSGTHASSFLLFDQSKSSLDFGDSKLMPNSSNRKYF